MPEAKINATANVGLVQMYLANERTLLAYSRTSLAALTIGVAIARIIPALAR
jgi:uncharacterized membrane protein YidH (DUF202 family)